MLEQKLPVQTRVRVRGVLAQARVWRGSPSGGTGSNRTEGVRLRGGGSVHSSVVSGTPGSLVGAPTPDPWCPEVWWTNPHCRDFCCSIKEIITNYWGSPCRPPPPGWSQSLRKTSAANSEHVWAAPSRLVCWVCVPVPGLQFVSYTGTEK